MGEYNPLAPQILGQEWVPIRESALTLTPVVNLVEVGHGFSLETSRILQTARFYVQEYPPGDPAGQVMLAAVYRQGTEEQSGPVRSVVVPCSLGTSQGGTVTLNDAANIAVALSNPSDSAYVEVDAGQAPQILLRFEIDSYLPLLNGKRILGVDFLYSATIDPTIPEAVFATVGSTASTLITIGTLFGTNNPSTSFNDHIARIRVGEIDYHWNAPISAIIEVLPWTPARLRGFDNSSGVTDRFIELIVDTAPTALQFIQFEYAALEIFFCEEQRISFGGKRFVSGRGTYILGQNILTMRTVADVINPTLAPGNYDVIVSSANLTPGNPVAYPKLNQLQQLYDIPSHPPVRVIRPFPIDPTAVGKTFETERTLLLPQLSLHASGGPFTEVHVYGSQAAAQVYGNITATQEVLDSTTGGARTYPWVRYYARRFGTTTIPLLLDSPSIPASSVLLTPGAFDELDEIINGWKEVTLRFATPPSMGTGTNPQWRWSATGEIPGNRWEVLGTYAPALSGITGNLFNPVPPPHQLSIATYGAPVSGANINLGWVPQYAPPVSATVDDPTADASLIFAQDLPTITGFAANELSQELVGIGLDCGLDPCCIPTALDYVEVTWGLPANTGAFADSFTRTVAAGSWGGTPPYTLFGTATDYSVDGDQGIVTFSANNSSRFATVNIGAVNFDVKAEFDIQSAILTGTYRAGVVGRYTAAIDNYLTSVDMTSTGAVTLTMEKRVAGVATTLANPAIPRLSGAVGSNLTVRMVGFGTFLKAKVWQTGYPEPVAWDIELNDSSLTTGNEAGIFVRDNSAVVGHTMGIDNLVVTPPQPWFSHYELQRMDTVTTDWQTIMKATSPAVTAFSDYEARVGILSSYRIRAVDVYDFPGLWSATVTATVPEPGVTIECDDGHLLIFTSNDQQDGSINLAYSSVWEGQVEEGFVFPESSFVQLQAMYNRDFLTAFRPTERGGEQFSRTVLVQAAAIAPETLADFTSLRDMAWADVSYICVRDEDGNRWFATVLVPSGRVLRDRRLYLAPVDIIEVTDTPSEVDPPWPTNN